MAQCSAGHDNPAGTTYCTACGLLISSAPAPQVAPPAPSWGAPAAQPTFAPPGSAVQPWNSPPPIPPAWGPPVGQGYPVMPAPGVPIAGGTRGLYTAAAIINWVTLGILTLATGGFGIIAAAWFVPMTIVTHKAAKDPYKHTGLAVCTLLFVNIISGILMLVDDGNRPAKFARY